jgi:hypothetical protein
VAASAGWAAWPAPRTAATATSPALRIPARPYTAPLRAILRARGDSAAAVAATAATTSSSIRAIQAFPVSTQVPTILPPYGPANRDATCPNYAKDVANGARAGRGVGVAWRVPVPTTAPARTPPRPSNLLLDRQQDAAATHSFDAAPDDPVNGVRPYCEKVVSIGLVRISRERLMNVS